MTLSVQEKKFYKVADHQFSVVASAGLCEDFFARYMDNYKPFAVGECDCVFSLQVVVGEEFPAYVEEIRQDEEGQKIICGLTNDGKSAFEFCLHEKKAGLLVCSKDYKDAKLYVLDGILPSLLKYAVNNSLMVMYALATASYGTALFHAAVVKREGKGYMFLGKSGTGKSTHARIWLKYNEGSELLNDDNPVVRFYETDQGKGYAVVYGSPWSGKTPCYKNEECELGGLVLLAQAPYNEITRLPGLQAYAAILPCISGKRWERSIADGLHNTENALAANVPVWYLKCLPDEAAAKLCLKTIAG